MAVMAIVFINTDLSNKERENVWEAQNGATRRSLVLINKTGRPPEPSRIEGKLGFLDKGNHSFIFVNPGNGDNSRVLGIFLCSDYGYRVVAGTELYTASSVGGYGNSESRFGVYEVGTIIAANSYKGRRGEDFWKLTSEGWVSMGTDIPIEGGEVTEID